MLGLLKSAAFIFGLLLAPIGWAQNDHTLEISPVVGLLIPHNIDGAGRSLYTVGVRGELPIAPDFAVIAGMLIHKRGEDKGISFDFGGRLSVNSKLGNLFFDGGLHYANLDYAPSDDNRGSTTGGHVGAFAGGGFTFNFSALPIRILMRAHAGPSYWLLLESGLAFRF